VWPGSGDRSTAAGVLDPRRVERLRTLLAAFVVKHLARPRMLLLQCWLWLAAKSRNTEDKRRCLHAVLQFDPENEPPSLALLLLDQQRPTS